MSLRRGGKLVATNAFALLSGDKALGTVVKCGVFKGDTKAVFVDRREFTGSLCDLIEKAHEYILSKINMGMKLVGVQRRDVYELPPDEMRELVVNAFAHRNYFDHEAPIFIAVYDTRVEITSPGGLPRGQTAERAVAGYSKIRNEVLAKALNYMRFIEEWGSGLKRVNDVLVECGIRKVAVEDVGFAVRMNVYRASAADEVVKRENASQMPQDEVVNEVVNEVVSEVVKQIFEGIKHNPGIRKPKLLTIVKTSRATAERAIAYLQGLQKIEFRGAPKTGGYYCKE